MAATLRDVAAHAGVSIRTVSNVVSGYQHVSPKTRDRVMRSIEELGYRPNQVARTLRTGRTGSLLLVVPEIDVPYFSELAKEAINASAAFGYSLTITQTSNSSEHSPLETASRSALFDGILLAVKTDEVPESLLNPSITPPAVFLGEDTFDGIHDHIAIDNRQAAFDAVTHLIERGAQRVAILGPQPDRRYSTPALRLQGVKEALAANKISFHNELVASVEHYDRQSGLTATEKLLSLSTPPDAIFCFSDLLAIGALRACHNLGRSVPEDILVMGIDDIPEGRYYSPSLSTISLDIPSIAQQAVELLHARIEDPKHQVTESIASHKLIIRESTFSPLSSR